MADVGSRGLLQADAILQGILHVVVVDVGLGTGGALDTLNSSEDTVLPGIEDDIVVNNVLRAIRDVNAVLAGIEDEVVVNVGVGALNRDARLGHVVENVVMNPGPTAAGHDVDAPASSRRRVAVCVNRRDANTGYFNVARADLDSAQGRVGRHMDAGLIAGADDSAARRGDKGGRGIDGRLAQQQGDGVGGSGERVGAEGIGSARDKHRAAPSRVGGADGGLDGGVLEAVNSEDVVPGASLNGVEGLGGSPALGGVEGGQGAEFDAAIVLGVNLAVAGEAVEAGGAAVRQVPLQIFG